MDTMETGVSSEKTESVSPVMKHVNEDTCSKNTTRTPPEDRCGTADVAKARWTLLRQVTFAWQKYLPLASSLDWLILCWKRCFFIRRWEIKRRWQQSPYVHGLSSFGPLHSNCTPHMHSVICMAQHDGNKAVTISSFSLNGVLRIKDPAWFKMHKRRSSHN